jgi:suppressor of ftsI
MLISTDPNVGLRTSAFISTASLYAFFTMKRRTLLQTTIALLGNRAFAAKTDIGMEMDHHGSTTFPANSGFVVSRLALPTGQTLRPLPRLQNESSEAGVFRANLVAAPGQAQIHASKPTAVWAYNGQLPGPLIDVVAGTTVEVNFENRLSQPTTVHWHGLPVPADQDGSPHDAVAPGGKRQYRFMIPQDFSGTCWYHPHPHDYTAEQVFRGLAGGFIVRDPTDALATLPEQHLLISDLRLDAAGQIPLNTLADWADGREGQFVLVNGQLQPVLKLAPGSSTRVRIWNATSARLLQLAMPGAQLTLVGTRWWANGAARQGAAMADCAR